MLSPLLDARTAGALLKRVNRPNLLTDGHKPGSCRPRRQ
jgi:hypothetical protein